MVAKLSDVINKTFDFVIIGGGTTGLVLANRLSADPSTTVAVLEAGEDHVEDQNVLVPTLYGKQMMNPKYDWGFSTVEQKYSNNMTSSWNAGKGLGGSSGLNFHVWMTPPAQDIDAIEKLGNPGWNWSEYSKYFKRSETFRPATDDQGNPLAPIPASRGTSGPIQVIAAPETAIDKLYHGTQVRSLGIPAIEDPYDGNISGAWKIQSNIDPKTFHRSYATNGYYLPVQDRPNLVVLTEAYVTRVLLDREADAGDFTATGAEFVYGRETYTVKCKRDVIISAGTVKDPQILELSGIGQQSVLEKIGVPVKVELPGVGENLQDHISYPAVYELAPDPAHITVEHMRDPVYAEKAMNIYKDGKGYPSVLMTAWTYYPLSFATPQSAARIIDEIEQKVTEMKRSGTLPPGRAEQYDVQLESLRDSRVPDCQSIVFPGFYKLNEKSPYEPGKGYISIMQYANHPFSRGTIHAKSDDPFAHPEIDPHYLEFDFDMTILAETLSVTRRLPDHEPFKSGTVKEVLPGPSVKTEDEIREFVKGSFGTGFHAIGSCSMLPRDKNGVVGPNLVVYGTKNLRVADLSIIPLHFAGHPQTTAYVVGEKAADIIRGL